MGWEYLMKLAYRRGGRKVLKKQSHGLITTLRKIRLFDSLYKVAQRNLVENTEALTGEQELEGLSFKVLDAYMGYKE